MSAVHRPHLDGVRAVAVYLVVAFHAGIGRFRGGHIGVDVFFVLSGYLVTGILLREITGEGRVRLGRFYSRRARRLLPAAIACLVGTAVAYTALASRSAVLDSVDGFRAASLYLTNWYLIDNATDYFAADTAHSPILHFWSLAVEEQFYLLWPLLFTGLVLAARRLGERRWQAVRLVIAAGGLLSLGWALHLRSVSPERAYYGTDARAYQLFAGALLALSPAAVRAVRRLGRVTDAVAVAMVTGLILLSTTGDWDPIARGAASTVLTIGLLAALESAAATRSARVLGSASLAFLGTISYATYLWHWPLVVLARIVGDFSPGQLLVIAGLGATGLAALSHRLLEVPVRRTRRLDRWPWPVAISGLAVSLLAGLVVLPRIATPDDRDRTVAAMAIADGAPGAGATPIPDWFDFEATREAGIGLERLCLDAPVSDCEAVVGDGGRILLLGDSTAVMWGPAFEVMAGRHGLSLYVEAVAGCPWQRARPPTAADGERCERNREDVYQRVVDEVDPDVVFLSDGGGEWASEAPTNVDPLVESASRDLRSLLGEDRTVVMIEVMPSPVDGMDPLDCMSDAIIIEECRFVTSDELHWREDVFRDLADDNDRAFTVDLDRLVCPHAPICDPLLDGRAVFWNAYHITAAHSAAVGPALGEVLEDAGLLP